KKILHPTIEQMKCSKLLPILLLFNVPLAADTIYLYDRSGSMSESMDELRKIDVARDAFASALLRAPDKQRIGFSSFPSDGNCGVTTTFQLNEAGVVRASLDSDVRKIEPQGSTPLALAIDSAGKLFQEKKE